MINMNVKLTLIIFVILPIFIYFIMKCNIEMKKSLKRSRKTYAGFFILMINMNVKLTLIIFVILPIFIYFIMKCNIEMKKSLKRSRKTYAGFTADLTDNISGIRVIKAFGNDSFIERKFEKGLSRWNGRI